MGLTKHFKGQLVRKAKKCPRYRNRVLAQLEFANGERHWISVRDDEYAENLTYYYDGEQVDEREQHSKATQ